MQARRETNNFSRYACNLRLMETSLNKQKHIRAAQTRSNYNYFTVVQQKLAMAGEFGGNAKAAYTAWVDFENNGDVAINMERDTGGFSFVSAHRSQAITLSGTAQIGF